VRVTPLQRSISEALQDYFETLDGARASGLYDLVMTEVERPLLQAVMGHVADNKTRAAELLGLSRGTLHKKLKQHGLLEL
jgi:Fis family transcriptional regulator